MERYIPPTGKATAFIMWVFILVGFPGQTTSLCSIRFPNRSPIINVWRAVCTIKLFYRSTHHFCYYRWWVIGHLNMWWGKQPALLTSHFDLCPLFAVTGALPCTCMFTFQLTSCHPSLFSEFISNEDYICLAGWLIISELHQPFSFSNLNQ